MYLKIKHIDNYWNIERNCNWKNWKGLEGPISMKIGNFQENHWLNNNLMIFNIYIFNK